MNDHTSNSFASATLLPAKDIFWAGAHKTGTTFLQGILDASILDLQQQGIAYESLDSFRNKFTRPILHKGFPSKPCNEDGFIKGEKSTIVFDENIIGLVQHAISGDQGLYPNLVLRSKKVLGYLKFDPKLVLFGIRNLSSYLPSLYCETLKSTPYKDFSQFMQNVPKTPSWYPTLKKLAITFPHAQLCVYQAEELRGNEKKLISLITGIPVASLSTDSKQERPGFSQKAIDQLHKIGQSRSVTRQDVHEFTQNLSTKNGYAKFMPFNDEQLMSFDNLYRKDIAKILSDPSMQLLKLN